MKALSYRDVSLVARYSELPHRREASTSLNFLGWDFLLPVVPANMEDVIDVKIAKYLSRSGYFYIMHRWKINIVDVIRQLQYEKLVSISVGVEDESRRIISEACNENLRVDFFTIDVAHGHHKLVKEMIPFIKKRYPKSKIIAGNVMTPEAVSDIKDWGADAVKVGVGGGSICTTRYQTGFYKPMFDCLLGIFETYFDYNEDGTPKIVAKEFDIPIIADGGVECIGDIAKALVAGATMVMCGKLFASCIDSPAKWVGDKKQYRGSTSFEAKGVRKHIEGTMLEISGGLSYEERLQEIAESLRSAISYAGGRDLSAFKNVDYIVI